LDPHDVILAEIAAGLHLDQFQRNPAAVGEPMNSADRDVDRLVLMYGFDVRSDRDLGGAAHHDPVLGTMVMLLQRERSPWLHDDALDLKSLTTVDRIVIAPWSMPAAMLC